MRKLFLIGLIAIATTATLVAFAAEPPENITLKNCGDTKSAVEFPHKAHFEVASCVDCHHTSDGLTAENVGEMEVATCFSCHLEPEDAETPSCKEKSTKKNPYHINCVGCHKESSAGPTKCDDCHPKADG